MHTSPRQERDESDTSWLTIVIYAVAESENRASYQLTGKAAH